MTTGPHSMVMAALLGGRKAERPPVANPTSIACHQLMDACATGFPEAHLDPQKMAQLALAGHEILGFDAVMPEFSTVQEAAALGCEVAWGDRWRMPEAYGTPHADFSPVVIPADFLERPSMRVLLEALTILRRQLGGRVTVIGKAMGPFTLTMHLAGMLNVITAMGRKDEVTLRRFFEALVPATIASIRAQFSAGADVVVLADHASGSLVGPHHYERYLLPLHREICREAGGPLILHVCGPCGDRLKLFTAAGFAAYHFEWQVDAVEAVSQVNGRMSLVGNVSNIDSLLNGTPEDVYRQARYAVKAGVAVLAPECAVPLTTPLANLRAIVEAAQEGY